MKSNFIHLHKIYRTKIKEAMNKTITEEQAARIRKCVIEMNNKQNCYETIGIHFTTVERILERMFAKDYQLDKLMEYCDQVEGVTTDKAA